MEYVLGASDLDKHRQISVGQIVMIKPIDVRVYNWLSHFRLLITYNSFSRSQNPPGSP